MDTPKPKPNPDFAAVLKLAAEEVETINEEKRPPKDCDHHIYEAVMEAIYGETYFDWYNEQVE